MPRTATRWPALTISQTLAHVDATIEPSLERLFDLLRIPSISTQPAHAPDCRRAAEWLCRDLAGIGFTASVRDTPGHPIVVAHDLGAPSGPHVLFYGHYDVQPVDPLPLWQSPPFEPVLRTEAATQRKMIVARGASDDKGQVMTFLEACRALRATEGSLPCKVSVILEGEEESGGANLLPFLEANAGELRCDLALICDTGLAADGIPAITTMLRGLVGEEVVITAADRDLHSGIYGNAARNPIQVLAAIIAGLRDERGRVTLPGFYDGVQDLPAAIRDAWKQIGLTDAAVLGAVGLSHPAGEQGYSALEQTWARPTCEVNGISGGYQDAGFKTVLPAQASAKISFRLVAGQDPEAVRASFRAYVQAHLPPDCAASFSAHGGSRASSVPFEGAALNAALAALGEEWGRPAVTIGSGGSIPVVGELQQALGMNALLVGFARDDDRIHSPNEKYDLESFQRGIRSWARILHALAATPG
ncbi:dipeptidase [Lichenicoccus sp.]|uniref:dipeptidase n=1 Tax=Lichenicoccus sp. TaxID=2781899 RepID=UPI003D0ACC79